MAAKAQPAKVKIDLYPAGPITFACPVEIPTATGESLHVEFTFRHRTRKQLAELAEERVARLRKRFEAMDAEKARRDAERAAAVERGEEPEPEPVFPTGKYLEDAISEISDSVDGLLEIAEGWNIDGFDFSAENLQQLCNLHGAAANAISTAYREALANGRLGNSPR